MKRVPMDDYADAHGAFRWQVPETFNFGADVVDHWARQAPDRDALIWCDGSGAEKRYSYAEMARLTDRFANLLESEGVAKGDRVIVMLPRVPEWQIAMVGCLKLGAVPIPCVTMLTEGDLDYRIGHAEASAAVTTAENTVKIGPDHALKARIGVGVGNDAIGGWLDFDAAMADQPDRFAALGVAAEDPAILYYTSGSTGKPKGVLHAARALFTWRVSAWYWLTLGEDDVMWCTADTGWSKAGTSILFGPWSTGSTVLFYDGPFEPGGRFDLLEKYAVTVFCAAATELRQLILEDVSGRDLGALRLTVSAGESVSPEVVLRWREMTGGLLLDGYGQTETLMTVMNYPALPVKPGSMGRPLPGTEAAILAENADTFLEADRPGRLAIKCPNPQIMLGYWRDPEQTAATRLQLDGEEWFVTGDTAWMDADGYLFYDGRDDDVINSAGYRIGPMEVENALMEHAAVLECAAVGSPDAERGEVVKAFVILNEGFEASHALIEELQDFTKSVTAPYKYPRRMEFVDELPKTVTGKIQRRKLRDAEYAETANDEDPERPAMTEPLQRDEIIELLSQLNSDDDAEVVAAARRLGSRLEETGLTWDELLIPDGTDEAEEDVDDETEPAPDEDMDDDVEDEDDEDEDDEDATVPEADGEDPRYLDPEFEESEPEEQRNRLNAEVLVLIDKMLAMDDNSEDFLAELNGYKEDIAAGEFWARDRRYVRALHARLTKKR